MPSPFISREDLTDILGRDVTTDDGALACVDAACDFVRDLTGQTFNRGTTTETFDGTGTDALVLPEFPVNSVGTVEVLEDEVAGTWATAGTADYLLSSNGVLYAANAAGTWTWGNEWPAGRQNVRVTYDHGYADADLPRSVRMVALQLAARLLVQGPASYEDLGDLSVRYSVAASDLTAGEMLVLRRHNMDYR